MILLFLFVQNLIIFPFSLQGHLPVISPHSEHSLLQQQTTLQISTLSLVGTSEKSAFVEFISYPQGIGKIQVSDFEGIPGLKWTFNDEDILIMSPGSLTATAETVRFSSLRLSGKLYFSGQPQWKLIAFEQFWQMPTEWSDNSISTCGGIHMLGGYAKFAGGEARKQFIDIPEHTKLKIVANYHFIDAWSGETGFLRASIGRDEEKMEYLWTEKYDHTKVKKGINVCGASYPEGKLTSHINIIIPHVSDTITLGFGSTLDNDPLENSFGISNVQIYIL